MGGFIWMGAQEDQQKACACVALNRGAQEDQQKASAAVMELVMSGVSACTLQASAERHQRLCLMSPRK